MKWMLFNGVCVECDVLVVVVRGVVDSSSREIEILCLGSESHPCRLKQEGTRKRGRHLYFDTTWSRREGGEGGSQPRCVYIKYVDPIKRMCTKNIYISSVNACRRMDACERCLWHGSKKRVATSIWNYR